MDWNHTATTAFWFSSWNTSPIDSPTTFPHIPWPTIPNFTFPPLPTIPSFRPIEIEPPTLEPTTLVLSISLAVRVVLFVICLIENSIAIFILHKSLRNGRKTFSRYTLINMACSDILSALIYYPAEFVKFSQGEFVWLVHGQVGDVLCKIYTFLAQIPIKVLVLCLVALACDVTRNLSTKGRREHSSRFSASLMILFWIFSTGFSSMFIVTSKVELKKCIVDPVKLETAYIVDLIHRLVFLIPANLILVILNLVIYCRVKRSKKEIASIREERRVGGMKVRRQRKQFGDAESAEVQQLTEEAQKMLSSKSRESVRRDFTVENSKQSHTSNNPSDTLTEKPTETNQGNDSSDVDVDEDDDPSSIAQTALEEALDMTPEEAQIEGVSGEDFTVEISQQHHTSSNPSDTLIEMPTETNKGNDSSDVDVDEEDDPSSIAQTALEEAFDMTREEAKIEGVTAILFVILTMIGLILFFTCKDIEVCSAYLLFAVQIVADIYGVIKPGIYAYTDKEFGKRYKQLSPFACCCLRRIQCHTVPQQVETRSHLSYNETSL